MCEKILFEIPEVLITTERLVINEITFLVNDVAKTDVSEKLTGWGRCTVYAIVILAIFFVFPQFAIFGKLKEVAFALAVVIGGDYLRKLLPKKYVLTITRTDKMFYEVITKTCREATTLQECINEAMTRRETTVGA